MKITNAARGPLVINVAGKSIELNPGQTATLEKDEAAEFKKIPALVGLVDSGKLVVDGSKKVTVEDGTGVKS